MTTKITQQLIDAAEENEIITHKRIDSHKILTPFPDSYKQSCFYLQGVLIKDWTRYTRMYRVKSQAKLCRGMFIMASIATYDGEVWYHVSLSFRDRIPSYQEMCWVRSAMFAAELTALQVFPPISEHVNIDPNCLHLWANLERRPCPDFRTVAMI